MQPDDISKNAVDLAKLHEQREAQRRLESEVAAKEAEDAALRRVAAWDRAMQRTFKGIMPRPMRHKFLQEAARKQEQES